MDEKFLWPLFSKPVFKTRIDIGNIDINDINWVQNYQNWVSSSQNVLEDPKFNNLTENIYQGITEYFYGIMNVAPKTEIYITESWFNKTEKGQSHHRHWHPNSILSAVVYLETEGDTGSIKFITSQYDTIEYNVNESNLYNSRTWSVLPSRGDMIIFPSSVEHMVEEYLGETPRISLAFNTFIRGNVNIDPLIKLSI